MTLDGTFDDDAVTHNTQHSNERQYRPFGLLNWQSHMFNGHGLSVFGLPTQHAPVIYR